MIWLTLPVWADETMKRLAILLLVAVGVLVFGWWRLSEDGQGVVVSPKMAPTFTPMPTEQVVTLGGVEYQYRFFTLEPEAKIKIIPNFQEKKTAREIVSESGCCFAVNAGFYTESDLPLGLFFANGRSWTNFAQSLTFNGFLIREKSGGLAIINAFEAENLVERIGAGGIDFVFQSGPLYDLAAARQPNFIDKKYARRHLVAQDDSGDFWFFSIFEKESFFNGPRLEDIPTLFTDSEIGELADFRTVLNLDGGSASYFFDGEDEVTEANPVGAILCIPF